MIGGPNRLDTCMLRSALALALLFATGHAIAADWQLSGYVETDATTADATRTRHRGSSSVNVNRLGFYSDLTYDSRSDSWFALSDRGPGGGVISYATRVQQMRIPFNRRSGSIGQPVVIRTIRFEDERGSTLNGLNPALLGGRPDVLGNSFDPEGFAIGRSGQWFVADEYGPSLYQFNASGRRVRTFEIPANLQPRTATGALDYVAGRSLVTNGRQDNRGFEGLTLNASGTRLYAVMQDPLVNEGASNDGRRSRHARIVEFDVASGRSLRQFVYLLESIDVLNAIDPASDDNFSATHQGRSIGLSAIHALSDNEFLVLERDNRGLGVEATAVPLHKRVYRIALDGATDVSALSLAGSNNLPAGVVPVRKSMEIDVLAQLRAVGADVPEKLEGLAVGPQLTDGRHLVLIGSDNDYSVTQTGAGEQYEVCVNRSTGARVSDVPLDGQCPQGMTRIPGVLLAFAVDFRKPEK